MSPPAAYFIIISSSKTPRFVKWMVNTDNSYNILKSITDAAKLVVNPRKCSDIQSEFTQSVEQIIRSLNQANPSIKMPTKLQEVCEVVDDLVQADAVNHSLMGDSLKRRLVEIRHEMAALSKSGLRPTLAR